MATATGPTPTGMVAITMLAAVSITETVVRVIVRHVGSGSIWRDGYPNRTRSNRNGCNHRVGRGIDDGDELGELIVT